MHIIYKRVSTFHFIYCSWGSTSYVLLLVDLAFSFCIFLFSPDIHRPLSELVSLTFLYNHTYPVKFLWGLHAMHTHGVMLGP